MNDKYVQLVKTKDDLSKLYGNNGIHGKLRYVNEQQKGIIDEMQRDIDVVKGEIQELKRQHDNAAADLAIESKAFARGRNVSDDQNLINLTNDIVGVHLERRRVQDEGENIHDDWVRSSKQFLDEGYGQYEESQKERGTVMRVQEIMQQISQSNQDIERLLSEMQRIERDKAINGYRGFVTSDIKQDSLEIRTRLDQELSKRERIIVELKDYASLQRTKADIYGRQMEEIDALTREIEEIRIFLRERYQDEEAELLELEREIEAHKERLRVIITEINEVRILIIEEEHHNEIKRNLLRNRDEYIERLRIALGEHKKVVPAQKPVQYIVTPGDDIDEMLAAKLKEFGIQIPLTRLGGGFYLFGTRKIFAKIMNKKLVVRVGGGYMIIDEFLATYSDMELIRINKMMESESVEAYEELKIYKRYKDDNPEAFRKIDPNKRTLIKSPKSKLKAHERGRF